MTPSNNLNFSDTEIHEIVTRVVSRVGIEPQPQSPIKEEKPSQAGQSPPSNHKSIAIGADHGGYTLKEILKPFISEMDYRIIDCGTGDQNSVDYPDFAYAVAKLVNEGKAWRGIVIDGAGIGSCMTANKVPGVRAAMCYDYSTAVNSREHNNANVLTLGAGLIGTNLAKQIVKTFLETEFPGGRHERRVDKISSIENKFLKDG